MPATDPILTRTGAAAVAAAVTSARDYLGEHPENAVGMDPEARARLGPNLTTIVEGPNGWRVQTGMATAVGGDASGPSPGWVMRAALASCDAVLIAMQCAEEGVILRRLETEVSSESDDRGLLGGIDAPAGPLGVHTLVHADAEGVSTSELEAIVERALRRSPVSDALRRAVPVEVEVRTRRA